MTHFLPPQLHPRKSALLPAVVAPACWLLAAASAHAAVDLNLRMETSLGHNSNVFKQSDLLQPGQPVTPLASANTQGARVEFATGIPLASDQTRLVLSSQLDINRYSGAADANHQASNTVAQLNWRISPLIGTEFQVGHRKSPYPFMDTYPRLDYVGRTWVAAEVQLRLTPDLSVPIAFGKNNIQHDDRAIHAPLDVKQTQTSVALRYQSPLGNVAQAGILKSDREYPFRPNLVGTGAAMVRDEEWFGSVNWVISPLTQVQARVATRQSRTEQTNQRATLYTLSAGHTLSPFWRLDGAWWNIPTVVTDPALISANVSGHRLTATWTPSSKLAASAYVQSSAQSDVLQNPLSGREPLNPNVSGPGVKASYELDKGWRLFADYANEKTTRSNGFQAKQNVWHVGVSYSMENSSGAASRNMLLNRNFD